MGCFGLSLIIYVVAYFFLMNRSIPAIDDYGHPVFYSSFLLGPITGRAQQFTIITTGPCWANYFFLPVDFAWRAIVRPDTSKIDRFRGSQDILPHQPWNPTTNLSKEHDHKH